MNPPPQGAISPFQLGKRTVGPGHPCLVVAEVGQNHDGSLGQAHAFIDAVAAARADAVKFQTHLAEAESSPEEPWRVKFSYQDASRFDYWKRMEFTEAQWVGLRRHAEEKGLVFLSSPFSVEAVELLRRVGLEAWKVASGELTNLLLFEAMAEARLPFLVSTGMSPLTEIDAFVERARERKLPTAVLQCTSAYPCTAEQLGLNLLEQFRTRYGGPVGLSDHTGSIYSGLAAAALGADVLEVHVTLSREMFGPDVSSSVTTGELAQLVQGVRFIERARAHPLDKDEMARSLSPLREVFMKSLVLREGLPAGAPVQRKDLSARKPGTGIPVSRLAEIVGRRLRRPVGANAFLKEEDLEPPGS